VGDLTHAARVRELNEETGVGGQLLASIDRRLALLTAGQERDLRRALEAELKTEARVRMFRLIDGNLTSPEIAKSANVSERAVQGFVKELLEAGFVRDKGGGRTVVVERDEDTIVQWYVSRPSQGA
jgi:Fic family protein